MASLIDLFVLLIVVSTMIAAKSSRYSRFGSMMSRGSSTASTVSVHIGEPVVQNYRSVLHDMNSTNTNSVVTPSLDNIRRIYELVGKPLNDIPVIHVGGTNGKGSVSAKIAAVLQKSGLQTGLFVSPHISSFRERAQVNGELLSEEDVCTIVPPILSMCKENDIPATFFDLTTIMAFLKFENEGCDAVVLEVGLGGQLDSTNVLNETSLSIITSVQLDHIRTLGSTIEEIALKKAGIMKYKTPVLLGPGTPLQVLHKEATERGAFAYELKDVLTTEVMSHGSKDVDMLNQDIAHAAIKLLQQLPATTGKASPVLAANQEKMARALSRLKSDTLRECLATRPPCRFQEFMLDHPTNSVRVILDVAHNSDAVDALLVKIREHYPDLGPRHIRVVLALSKDKMASKVAQSVLSLVGGDISRVFCVDASNITYRALPASTLRTIIAQHAKCSQGSHPVLTRKDEEHMDVEKAIKIAVDSSRESLKEEGITPLVLVCGSGFIMSDARRSLGIIEPRD